MPAEKTKPFINTFRHKEMANLEKVLSSRFILGFSHFRTYYPGLFGAIISLLLSYGRIVKNIYYIQI
jgi:hypothetical protein